MLNSSNNGPNWLGLLKYSLQFHDGTTPSEATEMSEEKRLFLENVMKEMTVNEPERLLVITNKLIQYIINLDIRDESNRSLREIINTDEFSDAVAIEDDEMISYLEECEDIISQIDMANTFVDNYKGDVYLLLLLTGKQLHSSQSSISSKIKELAATVLGALAQNNEKVCQVYFAPCSNRVIHRVDSSIPVEGACRDNMLDRLFQLINECGNRANAERKTGECNEYRLCNKVSATRMLIMFAFFDGMNYCSYYSVYPPFSLLRHSKASSLALSL
jgi:hypothetical protein